MDLSRFGIIEMKKPAYPEFASLPARIESFKDWPRGLKQKPEELANAGFYYIGVGDQTLCFHCGGGLKDWEPNDTAWGQHLRWFPKCDFLLNTFQHLRIEREKEPTLPLGPDDDRRLRCKVCFEKELGVVFLPCGHVAVCLDCSFQINKCPICRKVLVATVRAYVV